MRRFLLALILSSIVGGTNAQKIAGPIYMWPGFQEGYVLYNPTNYKKAFLIDGCGRVLNTWTSQYDAAHTIYLRPNGNLVRTNFHPNAVIDGGGGSGGGVEILDWDSNVLWQYEYNTDLVRQHHDIQVLPNGNVLLLAWEKKSVAEAVAEGRDPAKLPDGQVWPEHIVEVRPIVPNGGEIVWEWHAWDHLIQDFDNTKENFGTVGQHPELIDLNFTANGLKDWIHANGIDYNSQLDQIIISAHSFNEVWVIDHSTTTAQAASHSGGRAGKGGDLLYRWGNPRAYKQGVTADQKLFGQHHPHWVPQGVNYAGKIIIFNNRPLGTYSSVDIITPPINSDGTYSLTGATYGPATTDLTYTDNPQTNLWSRNMSSAQIMPNGNLFICSAAQGFGLEVNITDPAKPILWRYKSPVTVNGIVGRTDPTTNPAYVPSPVFRMTKFLPSYAAFSGRIMVPQEPVEGAPFATCDLVTGVDDAPITTLAYPNPADDKLTIASPGCFRAAITDGMGRKVFEGDGQEQLTVPTTTYSPGIYLIRVGARTEKVLIRH